MKTSKTDFITREGPRPRGPLCSILFAVAFWLFFVGGPTAGLAEELIDSDRDGFPDELEELHGTDPANADSHPSLADNQDLIIAHWPLIADALDVFPSAIHGTMNGRAEFQRGSLRLNGRDSYVDFGSRAELSATNGIAWSVWLRPKSRMGYSHVLGKFARGQQEYACFTLGGRIWAYVSDNGSSRRGHSLLAVTCRRVVERGKWIHVVVSWEADRLIDIYVNGEQQYAWNMGQRFLSKLHSGTAPLTLGAFDIRERGHGKSRGKSGGKGRGREQLVRHAFSGRINGLTLFSGSLDPVEVSELWSIGRNGSLTDYIALDFDQDGLPDWWERLFFGDLSKDAHGDEDGDGLTNAEELEQGLDPLTPDNPNGDDDPPDDDLDSDGDGLTDQQELALGMDPNRAFTVVPAETLGLKIFSLLR